MSTPTFEAFVTSLGIKLSRGQRILTAVAFDGLEPGSFEGGDRDVAQLIFGDVETIPPEARAVLVAVCGARGGKSYLLGALYSLYRALTADLNTLAAGELAVALLVAPDMRLARQGLRYALGATKSVPALARLLVSESSDAFTLQRPDGRSVSVEVLPATRGGSALRGRSLVSAVLDEAAFFRDDQFAVNDTEVFKAVAPRILPGGMVVVASTPWAEVGLLHGEFTRNHGAPRTAIAAHAPTLLLRDDARTRSIVERERERDPDNAKREFDAQFTGAGTGLFFDSKVVSACLDRELDPMSGTDPKLVATIGGDFGLVKDASAFVVLHHTTDCSLVRVAEVLEMRPKPGQPLKLEDVCEAGAELAKRHGQQSVYVDHHLLTVAREMIQGVNLIAAPGGQTGKLETHRSAKDVLNAGAVKIPGAYRRLAAQLSDITSRPTSGGGLTISSPRRAGVHGDIASAFVLACWAARNSRDADARVIRIKSKRSDGIARRRLARSGLTAAQRLFSDHGGTDFD